MKIRMKKTFIKNQITREWTLARWILVMINTMKIIY